MSKVTFIVGLPGSGKSHLVSEMVKVENAVVFDDKYKPIDCLTAISQGVNVIVADPLLCPAKDQQSVAKSLRNLYENLNVHWIYFENDPEACLANVERRAAKGDLREVRTAIRLLSKHYFIPQGADVRKVWRPVNEVQVD